MKKLLSVVLSGALVMGSFTFSSAEDYRSSGQKLKDLGLIRGDQYGNLQEYNPITRQDSVLVLLRMLGLEDDAERANISSGFVDVAKGGYYDKYLGYARSTGLTNGIGKNHFGFGKNVSQKESLTFMLRALGYKSVPWSSVVREAKVLGITKDMSINENEFAVRNMIFDMMLKSLNIKVMGENRKLGDKLGLSGYDTETMENIEKFRVAKVASNNYKVMDIVFSKKINQFDVDNYHIKVRDVNTEAYLQEDGKTVRVVFNSERSRGEKIKLIVRDIRQKDSDAVIKEFTKEIILVDEFLPSIEDVQWQDVRTLKLKFSEPIRAGELYYQNTDNIKVDGSSSRVKYEQNLQTNEVIAVFSSDQTLGSHDVTISGYKDYAGNTITARNFSTYVKADAVPPKVEKVQVIANNKLRVFFDEPVYTKGVFKVGPMYSKHESYHSNSNDIVDITFPYSIGTSAINGDFLSYKGQKDRVGNMVEDWLSFSFKVEDDTTLPVVDVKVLAGGVVKLMFSKSMTVGTGRIDLVDKNDKVLESHTASDFNFAAGSNNRIIYKEIKALKSIDKDDYIIRLTGFRDSTLRQNPLASSEYKIKSKDYKKPSLIFKNGRESVVVTRSAKSYMYDTVTYFFDEPMKYEDLVNLSNYRIDNGDFGQLSAVYGARVKEVRDDNQTVIIIVPNARSLTYSDRFAVLGIRDESGNMMDEVNDARMLRKSRFRLISAKAEKNDEILLTFSEPVKIFDDYAYEIRDDYGMRIGIIGHEIDKDNRERVRVNIGGAFEGDISEYRVVPTVYYKNIINGFGEGLVSKYSMPIIDSVGAEIKEIVCRKGKFTVHYNSPIYFDGTNSHSILNHIQVRDEDDKLLTLNTDYEVVKLDTDVTKDYVSDIIIRQKNDGVFEAGHNYKIIISSAWNKNGVQSKYYETILTSGSN